MWLSISLQIKCQRVLTKLDATKATYVVKSVWALKENLNFGCMLPAPSHSNYVYFKHCIQPSICNPFSPNSDQHQISPRDISAL